MKKSPVLLLPSLLAIALFAAPPAEAQRRQSIGDRVTALEQQANAPSPTLELLRQIDELRAEIRGLRAQIEELQHQNEETARSARNQYLDVDTRLQRLEAATAAPAPILGDVAEPPATVITDVPAGKPVPATPAERADYDAALAELKAGKYADSARLFVDFLEKHPNGPYAPNAAYWLGESYYVTENYALALEEFRMLVQRWPTHDKASGGLLKVALSQLGLRQNAEGRRTLQAVIDQYPGSDAARAARQRLQNLPPAR